MIITTPMITAAVQLLLLHPVSGAWLLVLLVVVFGLLRPVLLEHYRAVSDCNLVRACPPGTSLIRLHGRKHQVFVSAVPTPGHLAVRLILDSSHRTDAP